LNSPNAPEMPVLRRITPLAALVAVAVAFVIVPIFSSAFLGDDQFNSTINGSLSEHHTSVNEMAWRTTLGIFRTSSRFVPGFYYQAWEMFHFVPNLAGYKTIQVVLLGLDFGLLAVLLRLIRFDAALTALAVLFALTSVQFYGHYDGYLGFSATAEFWLALTLGSWIAFAAWLRSEDGNWGRRIAILLFIVSVLNYETLYPMSLGHVFIAMHVRGRAAWRTAWPFLAITVAAVGELFVARILIPQPPNADYALHLFSFAYFRTVFYQMTASLPLAHLAFYHAQLFPPGVAFWSVVPVWLLLCVAAVSGLAAYYALRTLAVSAIRLVLPACLGAWLWAEAALLLAAISRYQREVVPGLGYAPMVLGGFGAAIVLACALAAIVARVPATLRNASAAAFAVLYAIVLTASFETNERTLANFEGERAALINLTAALEGGVASTVPDGATLLSDSPLQIMNRYDAMSANREGLDNPRFFVREHSGKSVRVRSIREIPSPIACAMQTCPVADTYGLHDVPVDVRDGYTAVGRVSRIARLSDGTLRAWLSDARIYVRGDRIAGLSERAGLVVVYTCASDGRQQEARLALSPPAIRRGATVPIAAACPVDLVSIEVARSPELHSPGAREGLGGLGRGGRGTLRR